MEVKNRTAWNQTRQVVLREAYREFCTCGYRGANVNDIVARAKLTKGALYYYFDSKKDLALAIVDDVIVTLVSDTWLAPLRAGADPIETLHRIVASSLAGSAKQAGLVKLWLELVLLGGKFKQRLQDVGNGLLDTLAQSLRRGQTSGLVGATIDPARAAENIMAFFIGGAVLAEASRGRNFYYDCLRRLDDYIETLRPAALAGQVVG